MDGRKGLKMSVEMSWSGWFAGGISPLLVGARLALPKAQVEQNFNLAFSWKCRPYVGASKRRQASLM